MKVLLTSDIHMNQTQLAWVESQADRFDLVVLAGDLLQIAHSEEKSEQIEKILPLLISIRDKCQLIVSSGNHDGDADLANGEESADWVKRLSDLDIVSDGESVDIGRYRFTCCPWWNGANVREGMLEKIKKDSERNGMLWIWIHHAPPRGSRIAWTVKGDVGDPYLLKLIGRFKPELVLCGHVHNAPFYPEGGWNDRVGNTWVLNSGKQTGDVPARIEMDLETKQALHYSCEGKETQELLI